MKAFLLAAGVGSRMRPLTDTTPKCMLAIDGQPLLDIWLDALGKAGVDEVLVNLHHLPDVIQRHLDHRTSALKVRTVFEERLLGSAGTLLANREWVEGDDFFLACNADNLTDFDLRALIEVHKESATIATLTTFRAENPSACGVIEVDTAGLIVGFEEKPVRPRGNMANAGMYAFSPQVFNDLCGLPPKDIGYDLIPVLVGRARATLVESYFRDVGTPDAYRRAQLEWPVRTRR
jgi:mannose-1-phosphate guanylyltransferase